MTEFERMEKELIYDSANKDILEVQSHYVKYMKEYNTLGLGDEKRMKELLPLMIAEVGEGCYIQPPFYANWGGHHVHIGNGVYANFSLTLVDDGHIYIGDKTMIAPNVTIATASHPINSAMRKKALQYNKDVHIGKNVWLGAGAIILPGVSIGDNTVIGAGSVVTRSIPENVIAVGNPCKVLRKIDERDDKYYHRDIPFDDGAFEYIYSDKPCRQNEE